MVINHGSLLDRSLPLIWQEYPNNESSWYCLTANRYLLREEIDLISKWCNEYLGSNGKFNNKPNYFFHDQMPSYAFKYKSDMVMFILNFTGHIL